MLGPCRRRELVWGPAYRAAPNLALSSRVIPSRTARHWRPGTGHGILFRKSIRTNSSAAESMTVVIAMMKHGIAQRLIIAPQGNVRCFARRTRC